jgi:hypothetical protein
MRWINTSHLAEFQQKRPNTRKAWFLPTEACLGEPRCRRYLIPSARARSSIILQPSGGPRTLPPLYRVQLPRAACSILLLLCFWYDYLHFLIPMSGVLTFAKKTTVPVGTLLKHRSREPHAALELGPSSFNLLSLRFWSKAEHQDGSLRRPWSLRTVLIPLNAFNRRLHRFPATQHNGYAYL